MRHSHFEKAFVLRSPYLLLPIFLACFSPAHAANLTGDYSGTCDGTVQCAVEISDAKVSVIVADRMDYAKKICEVSGVLQNSGNGLSGEIQPGMKVFVVATPDGGIYLNGVPEKTCSRNLNGYYTAIGD